jgi:tetratricopeptide (TPR) repeat protein
MKREKVKRQRGTGRRHFHRMHSILPFHFFTFTFSLALCCFTAAGFSQDRVVLQKPGGSRFPLSGLIEDYTGRDLTIQVRMGDAFRRIPRDEIVEVQTQYTAHHEKGRQLLANGRTTEARAELTAALKDEDRTWVRREILAQLVRCALWDGNYRAAVASFLPIVESDPDTFHFDVVPLAWTADPPTAEIRLEAKSWIEDKSPVTKLLGASHLLADPDQGDRAETVMRFLARESNVKVQRLAQMQLWRVRSRSGTATPGELSRWETSVEEMPEELRTGGYFVLGQAYRQQQDLERAAAALLWLPLVYDADRHLAARACFDAAELLESLGDKSQATNLYSEVVFRFGDTPFGPKAETKWNALTKAAIAKP